MATDNPAQVTKKNAPTRVLIADANEESRSVLERLLDNCGYRVQTVPDARDCITEMQKEAPDLLIISQSHLLECKERLRDSLLATKRENIAVIISASLNPEADVLNWPSSCTVRALRAPLCPDELLNAMCELFESRQPMEDCSRNRTKESHGSQ